MQAAANKGRGHGESQSKLQNLGNKLHDYFTNDDPNPKPRNTQGKRLVNGIQKSEARRIEKSTPYIQDGYLKAAQQISTAVNQEEINEKKLASMQLSDLTIDQNVCLGKGAYGNVYLARHNPTQKQLAVKKLAKEGFRRHQSQNETLKREIEIHKKLNHSNIVRFYASLYDALNIYLVMEYVPNKNLYERIPRRKNAPMGLNENMAFRFFIQTVAGMYFLHKNGFIHRDLKPENLLVDEENRLKICDFGWAQEMEIAQSEDGYDYERQRTTFCGTPAYMAPEMINLDRTGQPKHGHAVDLWALGILLYELLHGIEPFVGKNQQIILDQQKKMQLKFKHGASEPYKDLVIKLLQYKERDRLPMIKIFDHPWVRSYQQKEFPNWRRQSQNSEISDTNDKFNASSDSDDEDDEYGTDEYYDEEEEEDDRSGDLKYITPSQLATPDNATANDDDYYEEESSDESETPVLTGIDRTASKIGIQVTQQQHQQPLTVKNSARAFNKQNQNRGQRKNTPSNTSGYHGDDVSIEMTKSFRNQQRGMVKPPKLSYKSGNSVDITHKVRGITPVKHNEKKQNDNIFNHTLKKEVVAQVSKPQNIQKVESIDYSKSFRDQPVGQIKPAKISQQLTESKDNDYSTPRIWGEQTEEETKQKVELTAHQVMMQQQAAKQQNAMNIQQQYQHNLLNGNNNGHNQINRTPRRQNRNDMQSMSDMSHLREQMVTVNSQNDPNETAVKISERNGFGGQAQQTQQFKFDKGEGVFSPSSAAPAESQTYSKRSLKQYNAKLAEQQAAFIQDSSVDDDDQQQSEEEDQDNQQKGVQKSNNPLFQSFAKKSNTAKTGQPTEMPRPSDPSERNESRKFSYKSSSVATSSKGSHLQTSKMQDKNRSTERSQNDRQIENRNNKGHTSVGKSKDKRPNNVSKERSSGGRYNQRNTKSKQQQQNLQQYESSRNNSGEGSQDRVTSSSNEGGVAKEGMFVGLSQPTQTNNKVMKTETLGKKDIESSFNSYDDEDDYSQQDEVCSVNDSKYDDELEQQESSEEEEEEDEDSYGEEQKYIKDDEQPENDLTSPESKRSMLQQKLAFMEDMKQSDSSGLRSAKQSPANNSNGIMNKSSYQAEHDNHMRGSDDKLDVLKGIHRFLEKRATRKNMLKDEDMTDVEDAENELTEMMEEIEMKLNQAKGVTPQLRSQITAIQKSISEFPRHPSVRSYTFDQKEENLQESINDLLSEWSISVDPTYSKRGKQQNNNNNPSSNQQRNSKKTPGLSGQGRGQDNRNNNQQTMQPKFTTIDKDYINNTQNDSSINYVTQNLRPSQSSQNSNRINKDNSKKQDKSNFQGDDRFSINDRKSKKSSQSSKQQISWDNVEDHNSISNKKQLQQEQQIGAGFLTNLDESKISIGIDGSNRKRPYSQTQVVSLAKNTLMPPPSAKGQLLEDKLGRNLNSPNQLNQSALGGNLNPVDEDDEDEDEFDSRDLKDEKRKKQLQRSSTAKHAKSKKSRSSYSAIDDSYAQHNRSQTINMDKPIEEFNHELEEKQEEKYLKQAGTPIDDHEKLQRQRDREEKRRLLAEKQVKKQLAPMQGLGDSNSAADVDPTFRALVKKISLIDNNQESNSDRSSVFSKNLLRESQRKLITEIQRRSVKPKRPKAEEREDESFWGALGRIFTFDCGNSNSQRK